MSDVIRPGRLGIHCNESPPDRFDFFLSIRNEFNVEEVESELQFLVDKAIRFIGTVREVLAQQ